MIPAGDLCPGMWVEGYERRRVSQWVKCKVQIQGVRPGLKAHTVWCLDERCGKDGIRVSPNHPVCDVRDPLAVWSPAGARTCTPFGKEEETVEITTSANEGPPVLRGLLVG